MTVPYAFGAATSAIPLSQLDSNFNTPITLGNTAIQLGNTVTTLNNMTLANVTISSGNVTITNVSVTTVNASTVNTTTLVATTANVTTINATDVNVAANVTLSGGTANGVAYLNGSKALTSGSGLVFDGSNLGLRVTPSAWASSYRAAQVGDQSALVGFNGNFTWLGTNWVSSAGGDNYIANGYATIYRQNDGTHAWYTAPSGTAGNAITFTQAMTLDASGNLLLGGTSTAYGAANRVTMELTAATSVLYALRTSNTNRGYLFADSSTVGIEAETSCDLKLNAIGSKTIQLFTNNTERARITSGGYFKASDNGTYSGTVSTWHEFYQSANDIALVARSSNASLTSHVLAVSADRNTTNTSYYFIRCDVVGVAYRFQVADSGNVTNTNGSYGTISDAKMKTDIVDAGSQWADIKAIRFRKFKMKDDPEQVVQLGVVAQELEQTSPGLVEHHTDRDAEGNDLGTTTKSVKTSVLLMKAAVALQEAMARIEKLEAEVATLKGA